MKIYYASAMVREDPNHKGLGETQYEKYNWDETFRFRNSIFYFCSLIETMARESNNKNIDVVNALSEKDINNILGDAEKLHNKDIVDTAKGCLQTFNIKSANYCIDQYEECPSAYTIADPISKTQTLAAWQVI